MTESQDPYGDGMAAFHAGKDEEDNPHPEGTDDHSEWRQGWRAASIEQVRRDFNDA